MTMRPRYPGGVGASTLAIHTIEHDDDGIQPDEVITVCYHLLSNSFGAACPRRADSGRGASLYQCITWSEDIQGRLDHSLIHGKEKVCGSIPLRGSPGSRTIFEQLRKRRGTNPEDAVQLPSQRMHPFHSQSPATATEGSRQRAASGQSGHRTGEVTLGRSSIGRAVSGLDGPHQDPGPPGGCRYCPARQAEGNKVPGSRLRVWDGRVTREAPGRRPTGSFRPGPGRPAAERGCGSYGSALYEHAEIEVYACARTYAQLCITFHDSARALTSHRQLLRKVLIWPHRAISPTLRPFGSLIPRERRKRRSASLVMGVTRQQ